MKIYWKGLFKYLFNEQIMFFKVYFKAEIKNSYIPVVERKINDHERVELQKQGCKMLFL